MRRLFVVVLLSLSVLLFTGCGDTGVGQPGSDSAAERYPMTVEDDLGRSVTIQGEPQRIVSLAPANTEILFALGLGDKVVGVTDYCDYPAEAQNKDKVGDFYGPSVEKTIALEPDIVFATGGVQAEVVQQLEDLGLVVVALDPGNIEEVLEAIKLTGRMTGSSQQAEQMVQDMEQRIEKVKARLGNLQQSQKPDVFVLVWIEEGKVFSAGPGTFVSSIVSIAGGNNVADDAQVEYPQYSVEKLMEKNPEVLVSTAHGYKDPEEVKKVLNLDDLKAVKDNRVYIVEDADLLTLPGPRIVDGIELMAQFLHPDLFPSD